MSGLGVFQERVAGDLTLYVRQMAWLNATPKPPPESKRKAGDKSRLEMMKANGTPVRMPPNPAPHIIGRFVEIGPTEAAGMGAGPISWRELAAWPVSSGIALSPWEARTIRALSVAYLAEGRRAEAETAPPPWRLEPTAAEIAAAERALDAVLG